MRPKAYTDDYIQDIRYLYKTGRYTQKRLAEMYFLHHKTIDNYCKGLEKKKIFDGKTDFD
jgi:DNA-binding MarR family transcriptional regulator